MRISLTYLYTILRYGYPHSVEDALRSLPEIQRLGFRYLELEGLGRNHMKAVYRSRKQLASELADCGLHVHNFCMVDPALVSLNQQKARRALDGFKMAAEVADMLGTETLHLASYAPPVKYVGSRPYELGTGEGYAFANKTEVRIPKGFDWSAVWEALVSCCQSCSDIAAAHDKIVLMEPRVGEVICSVDSLLRLIEHVKRPNFKANFDTAHFSAQRENVPLALMKLRGNFANIHIADNRPVNTDHLPVGEGSIEWEEFFRVLKLIGYDGYLGLDLGMSPRLAAGYKKSVERIQSIASALRLPIEV